MESQVLHTVWCNISGEAAGDETSALCQVGLRLVGAKLEVEAKTSLREVYSQLSLKRTPSGPKLLSGLERCPL